MMSEDSGPIYEEDEDEDYGGGGGGGSGGGYRRRVPSNHPLYTTRANSGRLASDMMRIPPSMMDSDDYGACEW